MHHLLFVILRFSIIEPGPVKTPFASKAMEEGPTQEELKNVEEETKSSIEAYVAHYMSLFGDMWQTSEDIAAVILEAITSPNPHFRYLTNKGLETWVKEKYVDVTGDAPLEAMRKRSLPNK